MNIHVMAVNVMPLIVVNMEVKEMNKSVVEVTLQDDSKLVLVVDNVHDILGVKVEQNFF